MAVLTNLESKLGEVTGLAMAARMATGRAITLAMEEDAELIATLEKMREEAIETERRCTDLAGTLEGKKRAILEEARTTRSKGGEMLKIYLDQDSDALDGFEFLTMAEAGEVGHWEVLQQMNRSAGHAGIQDLATWTLPIQQRHLEGARAGSTALAANEDPNAAA